MSGQKIIEGLKQAKSHAALEAENEQLRQFAREIISVAFEGGSLDGGQIQEAAEDHMLIKCVPFDPQQHAVGDPVLWPDAGDDWYVFTDILKG